MTEYIIRTIEAMPQRYDRTSKLLSPDVMSARLKSGEKPNDIEEIAA